MKKNKKVNFLLIFFRIISIVIIVVCLYNIYIWYKENKLSDEILKRVSNYVDKENTTTVNIKTEDDKENNVNLYTIDFNSLIAENSSTVGWIKVNNTNIDYPVVQHSDNNFYLKHSFDKSYSSAGWIYADYRNDMKNFDQNTIIYGHNRKNSSMFSTLNNILEKSWYTNPDNKFVYFYTPNGAMVYQVFSVYKIKAESYYLTNSFENNIEYLQFLETIKNRSIYDFGVSVNAYNKILTLSTCSKSNSERTVLHAKLVYFNQ